MNIITSGKMDSYFFALYIEKQFDIDEINFHKLMNKPRLNCVNQILLEFKNFQMLDLSF